MSKRGAISLRRRFAILARDGFRCAYCGRRPPNVVLHIDHVLPVSAGGSNRSSNLVTACEDCNLGKGASLLPGEPTLEELLVRAEAAAARVFEYVDGLRRAVRIRRRIRERKATLRQIREREQRSAA